MTRREGTRSIPRCFLPLHAGEYLGTELMSGVLPLVRSERVWRPVCSLLGSDGNDAASARREEPVQHTSVAHPTVETVDIEALADHEAQKRATHPPCLLFDLKRRG